jgi:hypothetical protein
MVIPPMKRGSRARGGRGMLTCDDWLKTTRFRESLSMIVAKEEVFQTL